ncbi:MAG: nicotinamide-nucleotide amidohydrolase family protein [Gallionellaceae bacterium]|nr:nicotinamide-nucleotide amidohydrolase family protein [Gallionellaceae bacterium]
MDVTQAELETLAAELGTALLQRGWMLATAESCTGGWAAQAATAVAGSSSWFERGFVTYSNEAKMDLLGVQAKTLEIFGAVSEEIASEMALGALARSRAQATCAITGIAGPSGGTPDKPVGTVCFAWACVTADVVTARRQFSGDRQQIRAQSVQLALRNMLALMT